MTPTQTITILRLYNEWRLGDEDIPQFDPRKIGEVIDAAVEMIDRLEAAEKDVAIKEEVIDSLAAVVKRLDAQCDAAEKERDAAELMSLALQAKIAEMERQEPVAWRTFDGEGGYDFRSYEENENYKLGWDARNPNHAGWVEPLYASAQPAPSVPEGWQLVPTAESRHPGIYKMLGALHAADNTPGMSEWESYRAMLSEAPEVKP